MKMGNNEDVMDALAEVIDPEMGISVTDLGLIYGVENQEGHLEAVSYTHLTLPTRDVV